MGKGFNRIEDILLSTDNAELIDKISDVLDIERNKIVVIIGVPNNETGGLDVEVLQRGFSYRYEEWGFIQEAATIVDNYDGSDE